METPFILTIKNDVFDLTCEAQALEQSQWGVYYRVTLNGREYIFEPLLDDYSNPIWQLRSGQIEEDVFISICDAIEAHEK